MIYYLVSSFINFSVSLLLGIFVLHKNSRARINRGLFLWCLSVASWSFFYFLWQLTIENEMASLLFARLLMVGAVWVPIAYLRVVVIFLDIERGEKRLINFIFALSIIFTLLLLTPLMVKNVEPVAGFAFWPKPGLAYAPFSYVYRDNFLRSISFL